MGVIDDFKLEDEDEAFYYCQRVCDDEISTTVDYSGIFFFGPLADDYPFQGDFDDDKIYAVCPTCGEAFEVSEEEIRDGAECPRCKEIGRFVGFYDMEEEMREEIYENVAHLSVTKDGVCIRLFREFADYSNRFGDNFNAYQGPDFYFYEYGREYLTREGVTCYENVGGLDKERFVEVENLYDEEFYFCNIDLTSTGLDGNLFIDLKDDYSKSLLANLAIKFKAKALGALIKYGFKELATAALFAAEDFKDSTKISEVLGADYNKIMAEFGTGISLGELQAVRGLTELNLPITSENVTIWSGLSSDAYDATTAAKTYKYIRNQHNKSKSTPGEIARDYCDYIRECVKLGYELSDDRVKYPTNLKEAHGKTSALIKIYVQAEMKEKLSNVYARFHRLCEYDNGKLCVIMPQTAEEIINEGKEQSHCVGNYVDRMANLEDIILFIRRSGEKNKSFYTMEIRPTMTRLDVVQIRGFHNEDKSPEERADVDAFIAEYAGWFKKRKAEPDKLTRTYYKAVRKTGDKYISAWDNVTEYIIGQVIEAKMNNDPDRVAVEGIHVASLKFAQKYGDEWPNVAILELEVDVRDIVVPNAKDQIRCSRAKVVREVPFEEMGAWGEKHNKKLVNAA